MGSTELNENETHERITFGSTNTFGLIFKLRNFLKYETQINRKVSVKILNIEKRGGFGE